VEGTSTFFSADAQEVSIDAPEVAAATEAAPKREFVMNFLLSIVFLNH
jgi:hypothetical protein